MTDFETRFLRARRELIRADFHTLNDRQQEAVLATEGPLLILAGAGSGKTTVLIHRIANLLQYGCASDSEELPPQVDEAMLRELEQNGPEARRLAALHPVEPWRILAITFTNKAAGELKDRLERMLGEEARDIWALTFHSACVRILRRDAEKLGFSDSFTIYDTADSQALVKRILKDMNLDDKTYPPRTVLGEISRAKDQQLSPEAYQRQAAASSDFRLAKIGQIYAEYMRRMFAANAMDFDDLIYFTVKLLQEHEDARDYWQRRFRYVLIDEYQDTNHLQYLLASTLAGYWGNICVVGDDDQSIYKFRGATIENILSFEEQYPGCRTIRLEQNYRSTSHILDAANAVIRNNLGRKGKELWTDQGSGNKIQQYTADNENEEAQYVASHVLAAFSQGVNWRENAVLYRMNAQSSQLEFAFKRNGIPYRIVGGTRFFDHAEIKDMLAYLNVIASPSDDLRLSRIINVPPRGIGERSVEAARQLAAENRTSLFEIIREADQYPELSRPAIKMRQFAMLIRDLRAFAENNTPDALYDEVLEKTGYLRLLEESDDSKDETRAENVRERGRHAGRLSGQCGSLHRSGQLRQGHRRRGDDDHAQRQGSGVLQRVSCRHGGGHLPRHARHRGTGRDGGGAAPLLCGHHPGQAPALSALCPTAHALRPHHRQPVLPLYRRDSRRAHRKTHSQGLRPPGPESESDVFPSPAGDKSPCHSRAPRGTESRRAQLCPGRRDQPQGLRPRCDHQDGPHGRGLPDRDQL